MRPALRQVVVVYGLECLLIRQGCTYLVRHPSGRVLARTPTRLLAIARAANEVLT